MKLDLSIHCSADRPQSKIEGTENDVHLQKILSKTWTP